MGQAGCKSVRVVDERLACPIRALSCSHLSAFLVVFSHLFNMSLR